MANRNRGKIQQYVTIGYYNMANMFLDPAKVYNQDMLKKYKAMPNFEKNNISAADSRTNGQSVQLVIIIMNSLIRSS